MARTAGLVLDPWQQLVLEHALAERADSKWSAFEVGVMVSRQNGKGALLEARALAGLFLLGERLVIHSAHQFDTSLEAFRRLLSLIQETPELDRRVKRVSRAHGEEGIELKSGQRIRFRTRTKGGGRGFTGDCLILDEAMILPETSIGALLPTLSARPNPQVWYMGSAVDKLVHTDGVVFARVRERGHRGGDPSLAFFEWSVPLENPQDVAESVACDPASWAVANPAMDIRISREHVERERLSMDPRTFAVERLGVGDWPATDGAANTVIDLAKWRSLRDDLSVMVDPVCLAFDVMPDRSFGSIVAAGVREDGLLHVEVVDRRPGTGWIAGRIAELRDAHKPRSIVCDGVSPCASLVEDLERAGVRVEVLVTRDFVRACGHLYDVVDQSRLRHLGTPELEVAVRGAATRPLVDSWAWSRKTSLVDISPLVAGTLALWSVAAGKAAPVPWTESW